MEVFLFSFNAVMPLILLVALGYFLARIHILDDPFIGKANRFCFTVAFPVSLFQSIINIDLRATVNVSLYIFAALSILIVFAALMLIIPRFVKDNRQRGALIQGIYRGNFLLLGYPLARNLFGEAGVGPTAMLLPVVIILYNTLAVFLLEYYSGQSNGTRKSTVLLGCLKNPLIIGAAAGVVFSLLPWKLPLFMTRVTDDLGGIANPLALILLGGQFNWQRAAGNLKLIFTAVAVRMLAIPVVVLSAAIALGFRGPELGAVFILFCGPTAVSSYIMAKNMNSDSDLASQIILVTTVMAGATLFLGSCILRSLQLF
ncbi:MAG: AEC family transporter [Clostridiaceae bacterium]|nr:AEC family transporter [Clostridiaceae bacterium]